MKHIGISELISHKWYKQWIFLPIIAYYLSMPTGILFVVLFPILLVGSQYIAIRNHPASEYAGHWWWWLLAGALFLIPVINILQLILEVVGNNEAGYISGHIIAYYLAQSAAEALLPSVFRSWRPGWWSIGNLTAAACWIGIYLIIYSLTESYTSGDRFWFYVGYPILSLFANVVTGYFLNQATQEE